MSTKPNRPQSEEKSSSASKAFTVVGIVLCVILIPILILNIVLIVKSYTNTEEVPNIGGYTPLIVLSGSMSPQIEEGDLIIVQKIDPAEVKEGDVIAFFDPGSKDGNAVLTHKVYSVFSEGDVRMFRTYGIANAERLGSIDKALDPDVVTGDKLVGIYKETRFAQVGNVAMFMQSAPGLIVCVVVPLILLVGWDIFRRRKYEKKNQQDTDALLAELNALKAAKAAEESALPGEQAEKSEEEIQAEPQEEMKEEIKEETPPEQKE